MNIVLTEQQEKYINSQVSSSDHQTRNEINKAWDGPVSTRTVSDIIRDKPKLKNQ